MEDDDEAVRFGQRMAEARNARGMTQPELSERLGKGGSLSAIQKWESGKGLPKPHMRLRIMAELGMDQTEDETRESWPSRVRDIQETVCDLLATMPAEEQRRWRQALIRRTVQGRRTPAPVAWSVEVEVIGSVLGQYLVPED